MNSFCRSLVKVCKYIRIHSDIVLVIGKTIMVLKIDHHWWVFGIIVNIISVSEDTNSIWLVKLVYYYIIFWCKKTIILFITKRKIYLFKQFTLQGFKAKAPKKLKWNPNYSFIFSDVLYDIGTVDSCLQQCLRRFNTVCSNSGEYSRSLYSILPPH